MKGCGEGDTNSNEGVDIVERWKTSTTRHVLVLCIRNASLRPMRVVLTAHVSGLFKQGTTPLRGLDRGQRKSDKFRQEQRTSIDRDYSRKLGRRVIST